MTNYGDKWSDKIKDRAMLEQPKEEFERKILKKKFGKKKNPALSSRKMKENQTTDHLVQGCGRKGAKIGSVLQHPQNNCKRQKWDRSEIINDLCCSQVQRARQVTLQCFSQAAFSVRSLESLWFLGTNMNSDY